VSNETDEKETAKYENNSESKQSVEGNRGRGSGVFAVMNVVTVNRLVGFTVVADEETYFERYMVVVE